MTYPGVVLTAMIGVIYLMLTKIMPTMTQTFTEQNLKLPATTQFLVNASDFLINHTIVFFAGLIITVSGLIALGKTEKGKWFIHRALIYMPVVGPMVVEVNAARAGRTLASLVSSGVDMVKALTITKDVMVNTAFKQVIIAAEDAVVKGRPLSSEFVDKRTAFPQLFGEMIAVGEETGDMATMLTRLAVYYETELEQKMKNINSILEPVLMLFIGGTVGFFAMAIIAPIYTLSDSV
jgi:type IV pilus assembly protein PilC